VTGAIKAFFKRLPEPVIPNSFQKAILDAIGNYDEVISS
jgi:hypothetical protein